MAGGFASSFSAAADSNRASVLVAFFALLALLFFGRLFYLQVIVSGQYSAMAQETRTVSFDTTPRRGTIYDRNGTVLATSVDATTIYANPAEVDDPAGEAAKLAEVLGGEAADYQEKLSQESTTFVYLKRQADVEVAAQVKQLGLKGVYFIADTRREYPCGRIGGQVIGFCNVDGEGITGLASCNTTTCFRARPARTRPSAARTASPSRAACTRRRPRWTVRTS